MASKTQKVITPENLGSGIAYNPQTKKWEVHFVSEAEIEQVTNYVEPQEDDEHYVAKECVKLRDRASGYMWDSCKAILKDRAPARDEDAAIHVEFREGSGILYVSPSNPTSNIDGANLTDKGSYEYLRDDLRSRFKTTKEYNDYVKDKKIKFVTNKRFANSLEGKPMIRPTTLEASYPVMQDEVVEDLYSAGSVIDIGYYNYTNSKPVVVEAINDGRITITGTVTYGEGEKRGQTETFNVPADILDHGLEYLLYNGIITGIGSYSNKNRYEITWNPKTITLQDLGHTYNITFEDFNNRVEVRNERNIQASDLSNVHWKQLSEQSGYVALDKYDNSHINESKEIELEYTVNGETRTEMVNVVGNNAKEVNESRAGTNITIHNIPGFTAADGTIVKGGDVEIAWVDLPYEDFTANAIWKNVNDDGAEMDRDNISISGAVNNLDYYKQLTKHRISEHDVTASANVTVSDVDGSNSRGEVVSGFAPSAPNFANSPLYIDRLRSGNPFKLHIEFDPVVIKAFAGKFKANLASIDRIIDRR